MNKQFILSTILIMWLCCIVAQNANLCPSVTQIEGQGNGGNFLYLTLNTRDAIMAGAPWKVQNVEYLSGFSPVSVKVIDPTQLHPEYDYRLKINPIADAYDSSLISKESHWTLEILNGSTVVETYQSSHTIGQAEEEVIPGHGIAITVKNHPFSIYTERFQQHTEYPNVSYVSNSKFAQVDLLGSYIQYSSGNHYWLGGIRDVDDYTKNDWIRAGNFRLGPWESWSNAQVGVEDKYERWSKEDKFHLYSPDEYYSYRAFCDYRGQFEHVVNGTWAPYPLASPYKGGPQAKYITPDTSLTEEPQPAYYTFKLNQPISYPGHNPTMTNLYSVDVVFTPDKTKWTRSVVLEACEDSNLSIGNALRHEPRKSPSVDKNGNPDGTGTGMGWFPGYAINVETGERLNIMFSENSSDIANNGADMQFNPTSDTANWGGCHFVYICGSSGSTCGMIFQDGSDIQRNFNNNGTTNDVSGVNVGGYFTSSDGQQYPYYDCGIYDEGKWLYEKFKTITDYDDVNNHTRKKIKMQLFNNVMWTSIVMPMLGLENYWLSDEATVYLRVSRPFMFYSSAVGTGPENPVNGNAPTYTFNTRQYMNAAPQVLYQNVDPINESTINVNNISAVFSAGSAQFVNSDDYTTSTSFTVPKTAKTSTIYAHSLWIGGLDDNDSLYLAAMSHGQRGNDFWPGPLSTIDASIDTETKNKWDRCFKITRKEVIDFLNNYNTPGYEIPKHIAEWPAHGDVSKGQAYNLAPYIDANGDNHYNPSQGDYPSFLGDMALFFIFNDNYAEHTETGGKAIGLEVHSMVYGFDIPEDTILNNTLFFNYKLFNRSQKSLHDTYIGLWTDWDIGYGHDDYVGCDVRRSTAYAYNGYPVDGSNPVYHFGPNPPVQTLTLLGGPLLPPDGLDNPAYSDTENCLLYVFNGNNQYAINGSNFGNGIVDDERMGMTGFISHNNDINSVKGDPILAIEYYQSMKNIWKDETPMTYGSLAHPVYGGTVGPECRFMFPGNSAPCNWGIIDSLQWSVFSYQDFGGVQGWREEAVPSNQPSDKRGLVIAGPFDLSAGSIQEIDYCISTIFPEDSADIHDLSCIDNIQRDFDLGYYTQHFTAPAIVNINESICEGTNYDFFGTSYNEAGCYHHVTSTSVPVQIDTCYILNLTVIPSSQLIYEAILPGTAYNENGFSIPASATTTQGIQIHQTSVISNEGCSTDIVLVLDVRNDVGIASVKKQDLLILYPNPTTDIVQFDIPNDHLLNNNEFIQVFDLSGRQLQSIRPTSQTVRINLNGYTSGTYIIKFANYIGKIIKK